MAEKDFLDLRNKSTDEAAGTLNPEDTRAEILEKREDARREESAAQAKEMAQISAKDERKESEFLTAEKRDIEAITKLSPEEAKERVESDFRSYAAYEKADPSNRDEHDYKEFLLDKIGQGVRHSEAYKNEAFKQNPEFANAGLSLHSFNEHNRASQLVERIYDERKREQALNEAREISSFNPVLKSQFARLNPDITPAINGEKSIEEIFQAEAKERATQERDNPEVRDERERMKNSEEFDERARQAKAAAIEAGAAQRAQADTNKAATAEALGNMLEAQEPKKSLAVDDYIVPRSVANKYEQVEGKFFAKDEKSPRLMFEDKGKTLATSSTDKAAISDMVTLAKAKQWDSLALSGSQEFRREAWLQAESQGIKTRGYTPKEQDLAALKALTAQRQVNTITPISERKQERSTEEKAAPRHSLEKNQAALYDGGLKLRTTNMQELSSVKGFQGMSAEDQSKIAFWRGVVQEESKNQPATVKEERLARFDNEMQDPSKVKQLPDPALHETGKSQVREQTQSKSAKGHELER